MRFIQRLIILALLCLALYFGYKKIFEPFMHSVKNELGTFYGPTWRPEKE